MTGVADAALIDELVEARLHGRHLDLPDLEGSLDRAQELQLEVLRRIEARGDVISGWKVGLTSGAAHDLMGKGVRPIGYILADRTFASGAECKRPPDLPFHLEPEICLEMKAPLRGRNLSIEACRAAVGAVRASFEINQSRVPMPGRNRLFVADGLSNWGLVVGTGRDPFDILSIPPARLSIDGVAAQTSRTDLIMDDPYLSLARLCATLSKYGLGVDAGQYVLMGAFFRIGIERPGTYQALIEGIGEVSLTIT